MNEQASAGFEDESPDDDTEGEDVSERGIPPEHETSDEDLPAADGGVE